MQAISVKLDIVWIATRCIISYSRTQPKHLVPYKCICVLCTPCKNIFVVLLAITMINKLSLADGKFYYSLEEAAQ